MKKFLFIITLFAYHFASSQCTISGSDIIEVGSRQTYQATDVDFSCTDCFQWTYLDQKVLLENDTNGKEITLKGAVPGEAILSLEVAAKDGNLKCQKSITVIAPTTNLVPGETEKCEIPVQVFKEIKIEGDKVQFEPEAAEGKLTYLWTVTYRNGTIKTSAKKIAQFDYSMQSVIDSVELLIKKDVCTKKIAKSYDTNFWYFF